MAKTCSRSLQFDTRTIHAGQPPDPLTGAVNVPVYLTSTYAQSEPGRHRGYEYSRTHNPTRTAYEECLASLEHGDHALAFSSGLAAMDAILHTLTPGDHIVCSDDVYGGTFRLLDKVYRPLGIEFTQVDFSDLSTLASAIQPNTKLIWAETPTNPMLKICDIAAVAAIAHKNGARLVVDNTFMSPYFQQPLNLGADLVVHSVTKYINGHSDVVGGALILKDREWAERLRFFQNAVGAVPGPMDCFLVLRGLKTLAVRMRTHETNALTIAHFLHAHPAIERVWYPGLPSHPGHELAKRQMSGFGGMISLSLKRSDQPGDELNRARRFLAKLNLFTLAESLGGVESLIEHPAIMTHASIPIEQREALGITDGFIRISVGIEHCSDLINDLSQALEG